MLEIMRERGTGWGARFSFAMVLVVFSEFIVWQTPTTFNALEWIGLAVVYLALAAVILDLMARFTVNDIFSLLLIAGVYGLVDATLISRITTQDLPISLIVRPLSAQPLAFLAALATFQILASGRATGPLDFVVALGIGLVWGVWVRWFPVVSDQPVPSVEIGTALIVLAIWLAACLVVRRVLPPAAIYQPDDWMLTPLEWLLSGGTLLVALAVGIARDAIPQDNLGIVVGLLAFLITMLYATRVLRRGASYLGTITPPRRPNPAAWLIVIIPFLIAGWIGYRLPGSGDSSVQSDILFGALTGFGLLWPPAVSTLIGVKAFIQLSREGM